MNPSNVPEPDDVTGDWWAATREHRLTVQRCTACDHVQHPPRAVCTACSSMEHLSQVDAMGVGVVDAFTVVHRAPRPDVEVPYALARVRLAEGPLVLTQLVSAEPDVWTTGHRVRVAWVDLPDGRALPVFEPAELTNPS